jgi:phosphoglycolate phosphatase-like HAD superfamily hydrolase
MMRMIVLLFAVFGLHNSGERRTAHAFSMGTGTRPSLLWRSGPEKKISRSGSAVTTFLSKRRNRHAVRTTASIEDRVDNGSTNSVGEDPEDVMVARELLVAPRVRPTTDDDVSDSALLLEADVAETPLLLLERNLHGDGTDRHEGDDEDDEETEQLSRHFYMTLPRHSHPQVRELLERTEATLRALHRHSKKVQVDHLRAAKEAGLKHEVIYANTYVDLGKINVIGFDFDYTLVTYTEQLLELIYDMALRRLVEGRQYPGEMLRSNKLKFDPLFSIRGLAVDLKTGWITHLSYTHKVAVAWEGREKLPTSRIFEEYRGKRALRPSERRQRLKPLNDLFSMAECCLIADTIQFFKDHAIPYCPQSVVQDVLKVVTETHLSGDFHRIVARDPGKFFSPTPHLESVLENLKASGKKLIFVSNSPYWYVDAGMRYVFGT